MAKRKPFILKSEIELSVRAYMALGQCCGFFVAEMLLMDFLPKTNPFGTVSQIAPRRLRSFRAACISRIEEVQPNFIKMKEQADAAAKD